MGVLCRYNTSTVLTVHRTYTLCICWAYSYVFVHSMCRYSLSTHNVLSSLSSLVLFHLKTQHKWPDVWKCTCEMIHVHTHALPFIWSIMDVCKSLTNGLPCVKLLYTLYLSQVGLRSKCPLVRMFPTKPMPVHG